MNANKHFWTREQLFHPPCVSGGRAGLGHDALCQLTCFDDHTHTHTHTHTPCQHVALVSELGFSVRSRWTEKAFKAELLGVWFAAYWVVEFAGMTGMSLIKTWSRLRGSNQFNYRPSWVMMLQKSIATNALKIYVGLYLHVLGRLIINYIYI